MPVRCGHASSGNGGRGRLDNAVADSLFDATVHGRHASRREFRLGPSRRLAAATQREPFRAQAVRPELDVVAVTRQYRITIADGTSRLIVLVYGAKSSVSGSKLAIP
jgi:hypothetical protein